MTGYTPIYNLPYPQASDLVSAYPGTGQDLAEEVETVLAAKAPLASPAFTGNPTIGGAALQVPGMVLITSQTVSAASSIIFNNCFSATYDNYRLILAGTSSTANDLFFRWRVGGTDNSTASSYIGQTVNGTSTTAGAVASTANYGVIGYVNTDMTQVAADIYRPFLASTTFAQSIGGRHPSAYVLVMSNYHNQATSYDGMTIYPASGTITATVRIYGYRN